jgi:LuxR family transcriptional regulator, maltose regulon positive regulatory protein
VRAVTGKERCVGGWAIRPRSTTPDARRVTEVKAGRDPAALPAGLVVRSRLELVAMLHVPQVKLRMPLLPAEHLDRTELLAELSAGLPTGATTLVCAPTGYGKTLLLTDWATQPAPVPTAWVTLDGGDDDPRRLWASVLAALAAHTPLPASTSVQSSFAWSAAEHTEFVAALVEDLHSLPNPITLILDNVDELTEPEALRGLRILIGSAPRPVHLVLSCRFDPPLGLNQLRHSGRLREVRANRLRFTSAESATLLAKAGLTLSAPQVQRLHQRTDGWATGLRLAALALTEEPDPDRFIADFSNDERCVADYLTGEVLNRLRPDTLELLRAVSTADPITAELAVEMSGRDDAGDLLESFGHDTSLLSVVCGQPKSFCIQPTLRTYLLADLRRHN